MNMITPSSLRSVFAATILTGILLLSVGCDNYRDDVVVIGNDIIVRNFSIDGGDLVQSSDGTIGSYNREVPELNSDVADAGAVLLYGDGELLVVGGGGTWTALPVTVGVDEDGDEFIDYSLTYSFSYDIQDLYIDLIASSPLDFSTHERTDFRLVMIPGNLFVGNARAALDYTDYEAVQQAYDLPE